MYVSDCMRTHVYTIKADATLEDAIRLMAHQMVGIVPVIDTEQYLLGVVVLDDVLTEFMPHFVQILRSADYIHDYSFLENRPWPAGLRKKPITEIMRSPYYLKEDASLMEAIVYMHNHQLGDVPVVNEGKQLVGLVSRARIGSLFLIDWLNKQPEDE